MINSQKEITKFYSNALPRIDINWEKSTIRAIPLSSDGFVTAFGQATCLYIYRLALTVFCLGGVIATCGLNKKLKISLRDNANKSLFYFTAIPFGVRGLYDPERTNKMLPLPDMTYEMKNVALKNGLSLVIIDTDKWAK